MGCTPVTDVIQFEDRGEIHRSPAGYRRKTEPNRPSSPGQPTTTLAPSAMTLSYFTQEITEMANRPGMATTRILKQLEKAGGNLQAVEKIYDRLLRACY